MVSFRFPDSAVWFAAASGKSAASDMSVSTGRPVEGSSLLVPETPISRAAGKQALTDRSDEPWR